MRILYYLCNIIIRPLSFIADKLIYRVKLEGFENVPKKQAAIICGNHVHALDGPCLVAATLRRIHFMSKKELFKNPGFRFMGFCFNVTGQPYLNMFVLLNVIVYKNFFILPILIISSKVFQTFGNH